MPTVTVSDAAHRELNKWKCRLIGDNNGSFSHSDIIIILSELAESKYSRALKFKGGRSRRAGK